jgi:phosphatidylglycerophosphatase A
MTESTLDPLPFWHPAHLIATWFGAGLLPLAPGSWGALAALPFAFLLQLWGGPLALGLGVLAAIFAGAWAAGRYLAGTPEPDPGAIVIDEVAGQWLTLIAVPADPLLYLFGFVLFRAFDIFKPWPVGWADANVSGGFGVVLDDVIAGLYGVAVLAAIAWGLDRL